MSVTRQEYCGHSNHDINKLQLLVAHAWIGDVQAALRGEQVGGGGDGVSPYQILFLFL